MRSGRILGIFALFVLVFAVTAALNPQFLGAYNLQNLVRWTALFGVLGIGAALVIITGGIDLSIGSVVGLVGALLPWLLVEHGWSPLAALAGVLGLSLAIGAAHGLLITRLRMQPFVVTLCGLLFYRGAARFLTGDQTQGFGAQFDGLRLLAIGKPCSLATLAALAGGLGAAALLPRFLATLRPGEPREGRWSFVVAAGCAAAGGLTWIAGLPVVSEVLAPAPLLIFLALAVAASFFLQETVWGRHLYAVGGNEQAARLSGIRTERVTILAYVLCSLLAGIGGVLFALDVNSIQPAMHGNFYELYAIAAAVLGGCSLRGGEGSILGVVLGTAVMRVLYNSINLLEVPTQLEFAIIGAVILLGAAADEIVRRLLSRR